MAVCLFHEAVLELAEGLYEEDGQKEISDSEADRKQGRNADEKTEKSYRDNRSPEITQILN